MRWRRIEKRVVLREADWGRNEEEDSSTNPLPLKGCGLHKETVSDTRGADFLLLSPLSSATQYQLGSLTGKKKDGIGWWDSC